MRVCMCVLHSITKGGFEAVSHLKDSFVDHIKLWPSLTSPALCWPLRGFKLWDDCTNLTPLAVAADHKVDSDALQVNTRLWKCLFSGSLRSIR